MKSQHSASIDLPTSDDDSVLRWSWAIALAAIAIAGIAVVLALANTPSGM
jgi:hypothetical protein